MVIVTCRKEEERVPSSLTVLIGIGTRQCCRSSQDIHTYIHKHTLSDHKGSPLLSVRPKAHRKFDSAAATPAGQRLYSLRFTLLLLLLNIQAYYVCVCVGNLAVGVVGAREAMLNYPANTLIMDSQLIIYTVVVESSWRIRKM